MAVNEAATNAIEPVGWSSAIAGRLNPAEFEARLSAVETRMEQVAADAAAAVSDAAAARHLAAAPRPRPPPGSSR